MPLRLEELFRRVAGDEPGSFGLKVLRAGAGGASLFYGLGAGLDQARYDLGLKQVKRLPAPVIGVGNLAVGGTGKTPLVMAAVEALKRMGLPCGVMSRGYGRSSKAKVTWVSRGAGPLVSASEAGDEPVMMASRLGVPLAVGADRYLVGRAMLAECGPMVLVGDDMFQHRRLHRDLNILAMDAKDPLEGGRLLPRGRLRESPSAIGRAQVIVLTRAEREDELRAAKALLRSRWGSGPILSCRHSVSGLMSLDGLELSPAEYQDKKVLGFCGLARPGSFARSLAGLGLKLADLAAFGDHYQFRPEDLERLWQRAQKLDASALVCSEKDAVRLPAGLDMTIWSTRLELEFNQDLALDPVLAWGLSNWKKSATR